MKKGRSAKLVKGKSEKLVPNKFSIAVGIALREAAKKARKTARMYGTPIYVVKDGKVVAVKP